MIIIGIKNLQGKHRIQRSIHLAYTDRHNKIEIQIFHIPLHILIRTTNFLGTSNPHHLFYITMRMQREQCKSVQGLF